MAKGGQWAGWRRTLCEVAKATCAPKSSTEAPEATWMNLEDILLSEISLTQKERNCMIAFTYGI